MVNANKKNLTQRNMVIIIPQYKRDLNLKHDPQVHYSTVFDKLQFSVRKQPPLVDLVTVYRKVS